MIGSRGQNLARARHGLLRVSLLILILRGCNFRWRCRWRCRRRAAARRGQPVKRKPVVHVLPVSGSAQTQEQNNHKNQSRMAARRLVFVQVVEFGFGIFRQPEKRRTVYVLRIAATTAAILLRRRLLRLRRLYRRMRERCSAHAAEAVLRTIVVTAMGAANVHGLKHSLIFGWQKGCCRWKLLCPQRGVWRQNA